MARLKQLRWVPMLIRAYYDAQMRVAPTQTSAPKPDLRTVALSDKRTSSMPTKTRPNRPATTGQRLKKKNSTMIVPKEQNDVASRLLRELRATNRKLKGLDDLRQQLKGVGLSLEEFNRRINEWNIKSVPSQGSPDVRSGPYPVPLDPFRGNPNYAPWQVYPHSPVDKPVDNSDKGVQMRF